MFSVHSLFFFVGETIIKCALLKCFHGIFLDFKKQVAVFLEAEFKREAMGKQKKLLLLETVLWQRASCCLRCQLVCVWFF